MALSRDAGRDRPSLALAPSEPRLISSILGNVTTRNLRGEAFVKTLPWVVQIIQRVLVIFTLRNERSRALDAPPPTTDGIPDYVFDITVKMIIQFTAFMVFFLLKARLQAVVLQRPRSSLTCVLWS